MKTRRGQACLAFVHVFNELEGRSPSLSEIATALSMQKNSADRVVRRLIRQGALERTGAPHKRAHRVPGIQIKHRQSEVAQPQP